MNAIKTKLRSERGASITFALLIFLVCSMVSIAVVVAGSAAAGRMSQRAETDQRYYAVTSAVELLCDDFKGTKVTVEYTKGGGSVTTPQVTKVEGGQTINNLLEAVSIRLVEKIINPTGTFSNPDDTLKLEVSGLPTGAVLDCSIKEYVKKDGRVIFQVSSAVDSTATNAYILQAIFDAKISQSSSQYTATVGTPPTETLMEKVTMSLKWSLIGVEKGAYSGI